MHSKDDKKTGTVSSPAASEKGPLDYGLTRALYSIDDCADKCSISRANLYKLIKAKELPIVKIGSKSLVSSVDLAAMLNRLRETSAIVIPANCKKAA